MSIFQVILGALVLGSGALYFVKFRNGAYDKIIVLIMVALGLAFVISPQTSIEVANLLGVGRGTDLLLYIGIIMGIFIAMLLYDKNRKLEAKITELSRHIALSEKMKHIKDKE